LIKPFERGRTREQLGAEHDVAVLASLAALDVYDHALGIDVADFQVGEFGTAGPGGVPNAHPHRYRDSFAVDMLARGASPYDVAKLLGDTVATVGKHYSPFVKELRERTRRIMESGEGLEKTHCTNFAHPEEPKGRIQ
jgi:hypothetical protein